MTDAVEDHSTDYVADAMARVSLLPRSQITELNFSGSSVARGANTSEIKPSRYSQSRRAALHGLNEVMSP